MKKQLLTGALAAATLTVTSVIQADPAQALSFNFAGPFEVNPSISSQGGIDVTASATATSGPERVVVQTSAGLGVRLPRSLDSFQIDGLGPDETLNLHFSERVNLLSATFGRVGFGDEFRLLVDGTRFIDANIPGGNRSDTDFGFFSFSPSPTGSLFGFTVTDKKDDYYLKAVHVTPVPAPAAVLPGLFGMGMAAFRKKRQADEVA
ncbi:PTPA-CTERM sorting domain-containing protein [Leptothoe sp. LEGE 181152]|nr:PTPA-CTERM sorting domain-containing protein [Leptothoe sp. LEGE 181152]